MGQKKQSIRLKLLFNIIVTSSVITFLFILLLLWADLKSNIKVAEAQVNQMEKTIIPALKGSLWKFDESQLRISLESFLSLPSVIHVELQWNEEQSGLHRIEMGKKEGVAVLDDAIRRHDLIYKATNTEEYHLGELIITTSDQSAYRNLYKNAIYITLLQSLKTFLLSFFILLIFQKVLTRHILTIAKQSKKVNLSNLNNEFSLNRNNGKVDELDEVVNALNQMRVQIQQDIDQKQKAAATLAFEIEKSREKEKQAFAAQKSDEDKSLFLASISHEIRTPMNAILGFAYLLKSADLKEGDKRYVDYIGRSAHSLLLLINNILDISKLEADKADVARVPFYFDDVIDMVNATFTEQAKKKNLVFDCAIESLVPNRVCGDQNRLRQILNNIVSNAIKFTDKGKVKVSISCIKSSIASEKNIDTNTTFNIQILVNDSGIGMSPAYLPKIFEVFSQDDISTTRQYVGTGLGMSIVEKLVTLLGGEINVESMVDVGTTVKVTLPFTTCTDDESVQESLALESKREFKPLNCQILVADDAEINQALMISMLESMGAQVSIAGNGKIAVEKVTQGEFDLVLMDIQMPVMNGFEAAKAIRQHNGAVSQLPIIALTANAMSGFNDKCLKAGMDDFLCKPFEPETLYKKISEHLLLDKAFMLNANLSSTTQYLKKTNASDVAELPGINISLGMKRWPHNINEYFIHLLAFIDEIKNSGAVVNDFLKLEQYSELKAFIHKISGSASFLALDNIAQVAADIEQTMHCFENDLSDNSKNDSNKITPMMIEQYNMAVSEAINLKTYIERMRDLANNELD
jgi:signal transduction histidine kinase/CheY-like chemotaxis protein